MIQNLTVIILVISSLLMAIGGVFCIHAYSVYEDAKNLMQSVTDLIMRDFALGVKNEGTDAN